MPTLAVTVRQLRSGEADLGQQKLASGESGACMAQSGRLPCGQTKIVSYIGQSD